jgi:hypothetical protein
MEKNGFASSPAAKRRAANCAASFAVSCFVLVWFVFSPLNA